MKYKHMPRTWGDTLVRSKQWKRDRRHLSIHIVQTVRGVAKVRERLEVHKQVTQKFYVEIVNFRKLKDMVFRKQYQIKISNRFGDLENFSDSENIQRAWENIKQKIRTSIKESLVLYALKQHKPWFDEQLLCFLDQRKLAKLWWLQHPNKSNVDNLNCVRHEASRHFRNKKKEYLKAKINELDSNKKIENIRVLCRGISEFKKGYQL
jgi:hypothetical protein